MTPTPTSAAPLSAHPLIRQLEELDLDRDHFVIFGSGPLLAHGLRDIHDLDLVARRSAWDRIRATGRAAVGAISHSPVFELCGGAIHASQNWIDDSIPTDELIDGADIIGGLRFAPLSAVLAYKQKLRRPKDIRDIALISDFQHQDTPWDGRTRR